tara:strand:+ start:53450 stop:54547 length:1098 start_codon:yes stop_codon:yes gene_type:complete
MTNKSKLESIWIPWMRRCLQLASLASGRTSPNPLVGAVVLDDVGNLVGEGFHSYSGGPHAEILALSQASEKAKKGTLIVSLEPCCHFGKTPPCTQAISESGVSRVVVGLKDPDPRVSGKGIALLREYGIDVITGILEEEAAYQNREFLFRVKTGRPWGILKWAMSLDGRIALKNGQSKWISKENSRKTVHRLRSLCDAVIVGAGTVRSDNPLLTTRGLSSQEPLRVVVSNSLMLPKEADIFDTSIAPTIIAHGPNIEESIINSFKPGPEFLELDPLDPIELLNALAKKGCNKVLWECGPQLATAAIQKDCVQELMVFIAPKLLGGISSMNPLNDFGFSAMNEALLLEQFSLKRLGNDLAISYQFQ